MEKVIKSVQTVGLSGMKKSKINEIKIMGMSLPVYIIAAFVILYAAMTGILPENMVGALAIMMVLGSALNLMGNKIPIIRSYLGGGAVFCIFASSALATFGILPTAVVENCKDFMNNVGFLDFYIAALITGSILGMNRDLLKKAAVRFLPISFLSMACAILMAGLMGIITGRGFGQTILYIALPMMSGGMGAGVIPLSGIYAGATGADSAQIISQMIPASAVGNVLAIICAALIAKIGTIVPAINGNGELMPSKDEKRSGKEMKLAGIIPAKYEEAAITAGLCTNSMGGTGNIAVLSASDRMGLIPFAQMATRLGGALVLISASFLITILG